MSESLLMMWYGRQEETTSIKSAMLKESCTVCYIKNKGVFNQAGTQERPPREGKLSKALSQVPLNFQLPRIYPLTGSLFALPILRHK